MTAPNLQAQPPLMTAKIQVTRAATGKVEDWTLHFTPVAEQPPAETTTETSQEDTNGSHP